MPNDAKLGMVVGVGLVIAIAVVFSRKDKVTTLDATPQAAAVEPVKAVAKAGKAPVIRGQFRQAKARPATLTKESEEPEALPAGEPEPAEGPNTP